jgi:murein DD-endopeptidase MepM/ murein hydrolase activator NlpD
MAADLAARGGRLGNPVAQRRRRSSIGAVRALYGLLVVCAGCAAGTGEAVSAPRLTPLMATTLLLKPVDNARLTSGYGPRSNPVLKRRQMHRGIDWAAPRGTPVRAAGNGVVVAIERAGAYGRYVEIDHGGSVATVYAHLHRYASGLRIGRRVRQGDVIGRIGSSGRATGPHLHYEVLVAGRQIDPFAVRPIISAHAPRRGPFVLQAGTDDGELGIGGPTTNIADAEAGDPPELAALGLGALPLQVDGAVIRVEDLVKLRPERKPRQSAENRRPK